jgi:hypothetical protein
LLNFEINLLAESGKFGHVHQGVWLAKLIHMVCSTSGPFDLVFQAID